MGPIGCPETSVTDYQSTLRKTPEERRSHIHRGGSLKLSIAEEVFDFQGRLLHGFSSCASPLPLTSAFIKKLHCIFLFEASNLCSLYRNRSRLSAEYHQQHRSWQCHRIQKTCRNSSHHARAGTWSSAGRHRHPLPPLRQITLLACWIFRPRHTSSHRRLGSPGCWRWQTIALQPPWRLRTVCLLTWKCPSARPLHRKNHPTLQPPHHTTKWQSHLIKQPVRYRTTIIHYTNPWNSFTLRMTRKIWARRLTRMPRSSELPRLKFCSVTSPIQCVNVIYFCIYW